MSGRELYRTPEKEESSFSNYLSVSFGHEKGAIIFRWYYSTNEQRMNLIMAVSAITLQLQPKENSERFLELPPLKMHSGVWLCRQ